MTETIELKFHSTAGRRRRYHLLNPKTHWRSNIFRNYNIVDRHIMWTVNILYSVNIMSLINVPINHRPDLNNYILHATLQSVPLAVAMCNKRLASGVIEILYNILYFQIMKIFFLSTVKSRYNELQGTEFFFVVTKIRKSSL
jgi:hypothetical protein